MTGISLIFYTSAYFRYYLGRRPVVIIADPDMLRQLMVKDFSSFPNRMVRTLDGAFRCTMCDQQLFPHELTSWAVMDFCVCALVSFLQAFRFATKPMTDCLLMLRNEQWKRVRSILTPSFSSAKLKEVRH